MILPENLMPAGLHRSIGDAEPGLSGAAPGSCSPVRGPGDRAVTAVVVDDDLTWVIHLPTLPPGAARTASPAALVHLSVQLACDLAAATGDTGAMADAALVDAAARAVSEYLSDLPELPLIGEPFGGEEGID